MFMLYISIESAKLRGRRPSFVLQFLRNSVRRFRNKNIGDAACGLRSPTWTGRAGAVRSATVGKHGSMSALDKSRYPKQIMDAIHGRSRALPHVGAPGLRHLRQA